MKNSFALLLFCLGVLPGCTNLQHSSTIIPERGVTSSVPAERWDYGFLTGNGKTAVVVYGDPQDETIVFNHERLYLPQDRPPIVDLGKTFPEVRRLIKTKGYVAAQDFSMKQATDQGHFNYHSDPFHYAFELKLGMPATGEIKNYLRTTDFETGEVAVHWEDDEGKYVRRIFVSRPDNIVVLSIRGPGRKKLNMSVIPSVIEHELIGSELTVGNDWITYHNSYKKSEGGYDNAIRVITRGGKAESDGKNILITDATEVLILTSTEWHEKIGEGSLEPLKSFLSEKPDDYNTLLETHISEHGKIFNRVSLDLGGGDDLKLTSEELLERAKSSGYKTIPAALVEKMYDASRFYFICSAGDLPPNLQGKWNGEFTAPWSGSYTFDTNVQNAMDAALSANMIEGMEGYFRMIESFLPDWRTNAKMLFGARGILGQIVASPNSGIAHHYDRGWMWQFYTAGTAWLASYYYDYYLFTGDRDFLANRALPIMKEIALFYEDFLSEKDESGHYIYRLSSSPEVRDGPWLMVRDNSTFNIAIAKELLTNLISACRELQTEKDNIPRWQELLDNMPPYQIGPEGDLSEWSDGTFSHEYDHRHHSPFYPVFRSFEFSPESTPELWEASKKSLLKKGELWLRNPKSDWPGIPFGRSFHAQAASYLGQAELVGEIVNSMADRVYPSLFMSLGPDGNIFNFDGNGAYPDIINRSLAFSLNGTLDLLRSVPPEWEQGSISGILARGQITVDRLQWNQKEGSVKLEITSGIEQKINIRMPTYESIKSLKVIEGNASAALSDQGANAWKLTLPSRKKISIEISYDTTRKPL